MEYLVKMLFFMIPLVGAFAMIVLIIWIGTKLAIRNREMINKERMALIEKGVYDFPRDEFGINLRKYLFWGLVLLALGIGVIIVVPITFILYQTYDSLYLTGGLVFLFTGLGILLFYIIQSKKEKEKKEKISKN